MDIFDLLWNSGADPWGEEEAFSDSESEPASELTETDEDEPQSEEEADGTDKAENIEREKTIPPFHFQVATANFQGKVSSVQDMRHVISAMKTNGIHLLCGQEARVKANTIQIIDGYLCHATGRLGRSGLCLLHISKVSHFRKVACVKSLTKRRIQTFEIRFHGNTFYLVNFHRPYEGCKDQGRGDFDLEMKGIKETLTGCRVIFAGDSNGQPDYTTAALLGVVQPTFRPTLEGLPLTDASLKDHIGSHGHRLLNFHFIPKVKNESLPPGITWVGGPPHYTQRCLDHIFASPEIVSKAQRVYRREAMHGTSDHLTICAEFKLLPLRPKGANIPHDAIAEIREATKDFKPQRNYTTPIRTNKGILDLQKTINRKRSQCDHSTMTNEQRRELREYERKLKRQLARLQGKRWREVVMEVNTAAMTGRHKKAFDLLKDALNIKKKAAASDLELTKAIDATIESLTQQAPANPLTDLVGEPRPIEQDTTPTKTVKVFTDGSKFKRKRGCTRAGAAAFIPEEKDGLRISCQVPSNMKQTSTAGEVCAVLLALRCLRHLPPTTSIHIVSDNTYVVYVLSYAIELYQQQDFSDVSHPDLWREIVRELTLFPRRVTAEWVRAHTNQTDELSLGNAEADRLAKDAARGRTTHTPPLIDTTTVCSPVRGGVPELNETSLAIRSLPKKAAPGLDQIWAAALCHEQGLMAVHNAVVTAWETRRIPEEALPSLLVFVPKADATALPRGITMKSVVEKVIMTIIANRLRVIPLVPVQYGFSRARDTLMPIKLLLQAIRNTHKQNKRLYCIFIDFENAYNSIHRDTLWAILRAHEVPDNVVAIIQSAMDESITYVRDSDISFMSTSGVPQGDTASPFLFCLAIDAAIRCSTLATAPYLCLAYADDVVLFGEDPEELQIHLDSFIYFAERIGLKVNTGKGKTEAMCILPPAEAGTFKKQKSAFDRDNTIGAFSRNTASTTADTSDGILYVVKTSATHLWCPICDTIQSEHTTATHALQKMQRHFKEEHPGKRIQHDKKPWQEYVARHFSEDADTPRFRERRPTGLTDFDFEVTIRGKRVKVSWTEKYKYLGLVIDHMSSNGTTVSERITKAWKSFYVLDPLWAGRTAPLRLKLWLFETIVMPSLLYGLASAVLSPADEELLQRFHEVALLKIMNLMDAVDVFGDKHRFTYEETTAFANVEPVVKSLARLRVALAGRIQRSNRESLIRLAPRDEWSTQVEKDIRLLDTHETFTYADLSDKWKCAQLVRQPWSFMSK